jgi:hypothetical protein
VWLREHLRISIRTGRQLAGLARVLDQRPALDAALSTGVVNTEQAKVITTAIADLLKEACGRTPIRQVLDLRQARRLFTGPVRRALVLRDGGCAFPGCDRPARWCDGHHTVGVYGVCGEVRDIIRTC